ncbi:Acyl-CoA reductase [Granulicatella balaenopterae]|uniref:Acyl-CoA reductase n=1 Tax=Granulicatella balaenopterae TaxID=137733 RepID=A0A1H9HC02_9LACT|nr:aldehyde dehydrogenase family protein [Granulicatella balaenopterae]SEQ59854.1 Acyl-CoA reductase [Granulicatella balaenopterae]
MRYVDQDLLSIQEARVLIEKSTDAQNSLNYYSQKHIDVVLEKIVNEMKKCYSDWIILNHEATQIGKINDEVELAKELFQFFDMYQDDTYIGSCIDEDTKQVMKQGVPAGGIIAMIPPVNTVLNVMYAIFCAVKTGNTITLIPHQRNVKNIGVIVNKLNEIAQDNGFPSSAILYMQNVSEEGIQELVTYSSNRIILNIGCTSYMNDICMKNKISYYASVGQSPVFIEQTANITETVKQIVESRSYNNGILPSAEQFVVVEECIVNKVKEELKNNGAYFMTSDEEKKLMDYIQPENNFNEIGYMGKSPEDLANSAGFKVPKDTKVLVSSQKYIYDENEYVNEIFAPVLIVYEEPNWLTSCQKCIELLESNRRGHTLAIHSNDAFVIKEFISKKPVGRIVVNAPASFASLGIHSEITKSFFVGGGTTGFGTIIKNIIPEDFVYYREVGYGTTPTETKTVTSNENQKDIDELSEALLKFLNKLNK